MRSMASRHAIPHITIKSYSLGVCTAPILLVKAGAAAAFFLEKEIQGKMLHRARCTVQSQCYLMCTAVVENKTSFGKLGGPRNDAPSRLG